MENTSKSEMILFAILLKCQHKMDKEEDVVFSESFSTLLSMCDRGYLMSANKFVWPLIYE